MNTQHLYPGLPEETQICFSFVVLTSIVQGQSCLTVSSMPKELGSGRQYIFLFYSSVRHLFPQHLQVLLFYSS